MSLWPPIKAILAGIFAVGSFFVWTSTAHAATEVSGVQTASQTWTKASSPYVVDTTFRITSSGVAITIEPGVVVKFHRDVIFTPGLGKIIAIGTPEEPIVFTSYNDDSYGGDTNGDGDATLPAHGYWREMWTRDDVAPIRHAIIRYGSSCLRTYQGASDAVSDNQIENCFFGIDTGFFFAGTIKNNILKNNMVGIMASYANGANINHNTITGNWIYGIHFRYHVEDATVTENEIYGNGGTVPAGAGLNADHVARLLIEHNNIYDNTIFGAQNKLPMENGVPQPWIDARNNWWGDTRGPRYWTNPGGSGDAVTLGVFFDPWLGAKFGEPPARNPVIIIPGILGSELYNGDELIWADLGRMFTDVNDQFMIESLGLSAEGNTIEEINPKSVIEKIFDVPLLNVNIFEGLKFALQDKKYTLDTNLFFFPYDWRLDLSNESNLLKQEIDSVKLQTGSSKVDIVAHSMGGLLVKDYINQYGKSDIDKLVFIGTPHLGAPKAGKVLLEGDKFGIPWLEAGRMRELAVNSISSYELLPNEKYFSEFTGYLRKYRFFGASSLLNYSETKDFLIGKGANPYVFERAEDFFAKNLQDLDFSGLKVYNIAGCKTDTQAGYEYSAFNKIGRILYTSGDKTVPLASASYINAPVENKYYVKNADHAELPSTEGVRELISQILSGNTVIPPSDVSTDNSFCKFKGKELAWRSPVEVHIYDSHGNHTGPIENGIEYGIDGVDYEIIDHQKFVFLPTDQEEEYRVEATGLENSTFDLQISDNDNGSISETTVFNDIAITPSSKVDITVSDISTDDSLSLDYDGDGSFENVNANAVLTGEESLDLTPPETQASTSGLSGKNNWFLGNVSVSLTAADDNSGVLETKYSMDSGNTFMSYTDPIIFDTQGIFILQYFSVDRAGNNEEIKTLEIKIDKTVPEISVKYDLYKLDFVFQGIDDNGVSTACNTLTCIAEDSAGNEALINFIKVINKVPQFLELRSISYNGVLHNFTENSFRVRVKKSEDVIKDFDQQILLNGHLEQQIQYQAPKDISFIISPRRGKEVKPGFAFLQITTNLGNINTNIK